MTSGITNLLGKAITKATKPDALAPIVGVETINITGRTYQAHKRGGFDEARERVIEETSGSVVWLCGVKFLNKVGDCIISKILGNKSGANVSTGKDAARDPFKNFLSNKVSNPKGFSEKALSRIKLAKVLASIAVANLVIGVAVPKFNHALTNYFRKKKKQQSQVVKTTQQQVQSVAIKPATTNVENNKPQMPLSGIQPGMRHFEAYKSHVLNNPENKNQKNGNSNVAFTGFASGLTSIIENTNTGQLMSTDLGTITGRTINARKKQERIEILVRDVGSIYFYMFAQQHIRNFLNKIETGRYSRLDPSSTSILHNHMAGMFKDNKSMPVDEFRERMFGPSANSNSQHKVSDFFGEKEENITLDKFNSIEHNPQIQQRATLMSELQPKIVDKSILIRQQVKDIYQGGEINNPKLLRSAFETYTNGASSDPNKFVKIKKLYNLKSRMVDYVDDICKAANKTNGGKVSIELLNKAKKKNILSNGTNFVAGFAIAALFLSTIIPKFQYWLTRKMTGVNAFPGTYDYKPAKNASGGTPTANAQPKTKTQQSVNK